MVRAADDISNEMAFTPAGILYRTAVELRVDVSHIDSIRHTVIVPRGYHFDGASIPRPLWSLIGSPFEPDLMLAACVHDWYCEHCGENYQLRVIGDAVFFFLLAKAGVSHWRRALLYLAVRLHSFWTYGMKS